MPSSAMLSLDEHYYNLCKLISSQLLSPDDAKAEAAGAVAENVGTRAVDTVGAGIGVTGTGRQ